MESLVQDLRFGAKLLWKQKAFTLAAIMTLTMCIGANTAIFTVVHSVVLKPLPLPEADRILMLYNSYPRAGVERSSNGVPDYYDRLREVSVFEEQALYNHPGLTVGEAGSVEQIEGLGVTPSFFRLLRVRPLLGRIFTEEESEPGNERKVILGYSLWQQLYGGSASAIGKDLRIYGNPYTIVGVMPKDFVFLYPEVRLFRPLAFTQEQKSDDARHGNNWEMIGRLKPGATLEQAQAQIDTLNAANLERFPKFKATLINAGFHTKVVNLQEEVVRGIRRTLYLLWGGALFVLLIGEVNIANLVLARSNARTRELAVRFALGANRMRVTRQLLTESVLLTGISAVLGVILGNWGLRIVSVLRLDQIPRGHEIATDGTVVLFILALAFLVGIAISIIPVAHWIRLDLSLAFREDLRSSTGGRGAKVTRNTLVVAQVAFALILLMGAGLLLASFREVMAVKPGFVPAQVLTGSVALPSVRYGKDTERIAFMDRALERLRAIPGVVEAGATDTIPFSENTSDIVILAEGYIMKPGESPISPYHVSITPGYCEAMRIPLIEGRFFDRSDTQDSRRVIIVDRRLAHKFWPNGSPVGKRMWHPRSPEATQPDKDTPLYTIVGVLESVKQHGLVDPDERLGAVYFPYTQQTGSGFTFVMRTATAPHGLTGAARRAITELDRQLPLFDVHSMEERMDESLVNRRSPMWLALSFAAVALLLAGVGIYGVLAYLVAQRTKEIGIRLALGGDAERVFRLILKEGVLILTIGFGLGMAGALTLGRYLEGVLYGVRPMDPVVIAFATGVLGVTAIVACVLPARQATRVDPIIALRQE